MPSMQEKERVAFSHLIGLGELYLIDDIITRKDYLAYLKGKTDLTKNERGRLRYWLGVDDDDIDILYHRYHGQV